MSFRGITKDYVKVLRGRKRPPWAPIERSILEIPGLAGGYLSNSKVKPRVISVPVLLKKKNFPDLQKLKEDLADWLITDKEEPLIFDDEEDRTYYAVVNDELDLDEMVRYGHGTIEFICPDPYKYGEEQSLEFTSDVFTIENEGTIEAQPIFELDVLAPVTFAMVQNDNEDYQMIGIPVEVDTEVVDKTTQIIYEYGQTLNEWYTPSGNWSGNFASTGTAIVVDNWGAGEEWHGPALMKEIDPLDDYEIELYVYTRTEREDQTFRVSTNYYDENMNQLGMLRLWDKTTNQVRKVVEARVGPYVGDDINYLISHRNYNIQGQRVWGGIVRLRKEGNKLTFYAARVTQGGRHVSSVKQVYMDVNKEYAGRLKYIRFDIANYGDTRTPNEVRIEHLKVRKISKIKVDQTPYIAYPGDTITFDHYNKELLINGEDVKELKDFGGSFFDLDKGPNQLVVQPSDSFNTRIKYRDRFR
ncbi:phage tail family protein [Virgibacillus sp. AGTR]|uniref:distal tail protein Dit n=1 Tax=Virgibacillus sp. AGTR TaxID=2812055 RepID=UPI001D16BDE5|nr:distal tail protein Dit [Virgibacillus sp. AGTR]MCC2249073.1 phage tail family protein [Virgibacillus sp. AGTR]